MSSWMDWMIGWRHFYLLLFYLSLCSSTEDSSRVLKKNSIRVENDRFNPPGSFTIANNRFVLDGEPFQIYAGEMHYFRIHPGYWKDRLERMVLMSFNTIQIYVPWNFHEPSPGQYNFEDFADLIRFVELCQSYNLFVSFRPGPYICAEWDLGGLPWWLLQTDPPIRLRSDDPRFLEPVKAWFDTLLPMVEPFLYKNGGPIIAVQIENEFGAYGDVSKNLGDRKYLEFLVDLVKSHLGDDLVLFTVDWHHLENLKAGSLNSSAVLTTSDFGDHEDEKEAWRNTQEMNPPGMRVRFNPEFYTGWLTRWGEAPHNSSGNNLGASMYRQLSQGGSVALYMAHGGTNFGFWAGANGNTTLFHSALTSYDYNAPIGENGRETIAEEGISKYKLIKVFYIKVVDWEVYKQMKTFQECIFQTPEEREDICNDLDWQRRVMDSVLAYKVSQFPKAPALESYGKVEMREMAVVLDSLEQLTPGGVSIRSEMLKSMEQLGQGSGFILYRNTVPVSWGGAMLNITGIRDHAQVFIDGEFVDAAYRPDNMSLLMPSFKDVEGQHDPSHTLDILVENMGHINFNVSFLFDRKGLLGHVKYGFKELKNWEIFLLPMESNLIESLPFVSVQSCRDDCSSGTQPTIYRGFFPVTNPRDTFLNMLCWQKGVVWINGFNLGRYFFKGPQQTLFIPKFLLNAKAENEIVVLELYKPLSASASTVPAIIFQESSIDNLLIENSEQHLDACISQQQQWIKSELY